MKRSVPTRFAAGMRVWWFMTVLAGCNTSSDVSNAAGTDPQAVREATRDDAREAILLMLQARDVPLSVHPSCKSVGAHSADTNIGEYVAGFLSYMNDGGNRLEADCKPLTEDFAGKICSVWLKHSDEEDEWAWGLQMKSDDRGRLVRSSVRCLGSG